MFKRNYLKSSKLLRVPTQQSLLLFFEMSPCVLLSNAYKKGLRKSYFSWIDRSYENKTKAKQNKWTQSTHNFLGDSTCNTCAKCQRKIVNCTLVGASWNCTFKSYSFWYRTSLSQKSLTSIFTVQNQYI